MSDEPQGGGAGEIDALKWYVYGMAGASVVCAGFVWFFNKQATEVRAGVETAKKSLAEMADGKNEITAMLSAFKRNKEDEARDQPLTWFQARWQEVGIGPGFVAPESWKTPVDVSQDGTYKEEKIGMKFSTRTPLKREQIGRFLHNIEQHSSRLRILTLRVSRAGRDEALADDLWSGQCEVGYRYPNVKE